MARISNAQGYVDPSESSMTEYALLPHYGIPIGAHGNAGMTITIAFNQSVALSTWRRRL